MNTVLPEIPAIDKAAVERALIHQESLTKPAGSLGRLEDISIQLAGITGMDHPKLHKKAVIVMAADHGVAKSGVSAYPPEVTPQMVLNFLNGGAAINVLARQAGAEVFIVDIGVDYDFGNLSGLIDKKIAYGTKNMLIESAMNAAQAENAIQTGIALVQEKIQQGINLVATGDMGIGNTTPSAAICAAITGFPVAQVTGRGTGIDEAGLDKKIRVISQALKFHNPNPEDAFDVLCKVGGFEIGGLAGVMIGAAAKRVPVVIDGFISGAAALIATGLCPGVRDYLIAGHQSVEIGHRVMLQHMGLKALLDLDLRLGEGTGAILAVNIVEAAARILSEMATFNEAGVSNRS